MPRDDNRRNLPSFPTRRSSDLTGWQQITVAYPVAAPGSTLDYNAYVTNAPPGTCFDADDAARSVEHTSQLQSPPSVALPLPPATETAPLAVTADASASTDADVS